jgi:hypothetical protein
MVGSQVLERSTCGVLSPCGTSIGEVTESPSNRLAEACFPCRSFRKSADQSPNLPVCGGTRCVGDLKPKYSLRYSPRE